MSLFIELLDASGQVVARRVATAVPCTVGRGADATLVVDDEYVEAVHAEIVADASGGLLVRDLESVNGVRRIGSDATERLLPLTLHDPVQLGRAVIRLADSARSRATPLPGGAPVPRWLGLARKRRVQIAAPIALLLIVIAFFYASTNDVRPAESLVFVALALGLFFAFWVAGWAVATRVRHGEARFGQHLAASVFSAGLMLPISEAVGWTNFLAPGSAIVKGLELLTSVLGIYLALRLHLRVYNPSFGPRMPVMALAVAGGFTACTYGLGALGDNDFPAKAIFAAQLKPVPASFVPVTSADAYRAQVEALRAKLDADQDTLPSFGDPPSTAATTRADESE